MPIDQEGRICSSRRKASHHSWHQIANDDQIADSHAKALDGDGGIEYDGQVRIGQLGESGEGYVPARSPPAVPEGAREFVRRESLPCTTVPATVPPSGASCTTPVAEVVAAFTETTGAVVPVTTTGRVPVTPVTVPAAGVVQERLPEPSV